MNLVVHKNEMLSRTNNMLFYNYTFTGKEKDSETGYCYFGARYYDSDLSGLFLSVDPMSDKYPSISPYAYCAWNPVKLVDPDGREVYIYGDQSDKAVACPWFRPPLTPPNLGGEEISLSIPFPLLT